MKKITAFLALVLVMGCSHEFLAAEEDSVPEDKFGQSYEECDEDKPKYTKVYCEDRDDGRD